MLKSFFIYILLIFPFLSNAQKTGSITIIADADMPLKLYLDNVKQNDSAVTQIRIDGLTDLWYRVKAVNANTDTLYVSRSLLVKGIDTEPVDVTYRVRRLSNGKVRVTLYSMYSPNPDYIAPKGMYVTNIKFPEPISEETVVATNGIDKKKNEQIAQANYGDSKKEDVTLKTKIKTPKKDSKNKSEIKVSSQENQNLHVNKEVKNKAEEKAKVEKSKAPLKKCNGWPITKKDFDLMLKTILESKTEEIKLKNAKSLITGSCFLVSQLDEIIVLFKTEELKLDFVKYAYSYTIDRPNYFKLEKNFTTSKNKEEFSLIHGD